MTFEGDNQFTQFGTYVIGCGMFTCIFLQIHWLAKGLQTFDAVFIVPVFQCFFISTSILGGGVYFDEFATMRVSTASSFIHSSIGRTANNTCVDDHVLLWRRHHVVWRLSAVDAGYDRFATDRAFSRRGSFTDLYQEGSKETRNPSSMAMYEENREHRWGDDQDNFQQEAGFCCHPTGGLASHSAADLTRGRSRRTELVFDSTDCFQGTIAARITNTLLLLYTPRYVFKFRCSRSCGLLSKSTNSKS